MIARFALCAGIFLCSSSAMSQSFKPNDRDLSLEFTLLWQTGSAPIRTQVSEIKARYFRVTDEQTTAYRLRIAPSFGRESSSVTFAPLQVSDRTLTQYSVEAALGFEKHRGSNPQLSAYYGAEIVFSTEYNELDASNTLDGLNFTDGAHLNSSVSGGFGFGAAALAGIDFYPTERLFIGAEMSLLMGYRHLGYQQTAITNQGLTTNVEQNLGTQIGLEISNRNGIRLGFLF